MGAFKKIFGGRAHRGTRPEKFATGSGSNLLTRAAMVALKERLPLIVCHRETPLSLIDIENMRTLTLAGAVIAPTNPGLYLLPESVDDLIDFDADEFVDALFD